jgi:hypothetical protein
VETLRAFGVQAANDRVVFPYPNGAKERPDPTKPLSEGQRRFYFTKGKVPDLFQPPVQPESDTAFLCEGETDTMRLWQESEGKTPVYGIGGINTWHEGLARQLEPYKQVYTVLDNDNDYMVRGQVDAAWRKIRHDVRHARRVTLPHDVKDVCEFFDRYDLDTLVMLTKKMAQSRFTPLDFTTPPPPTRWLLRDWIAMGDVTVLAGVGGLGKSLVLQALTLALLRGDAECFGQPVEEHGRVLLVDEENPPDVVYSRMLRFGLDPAQHAGSLRYLLNQDLRLDRDPDTLLDEALDFKPVLIGLDSLTRLHTLDENSNAEIARLFNDSIKPLARETGAACVLIHHHDKSGLGARGAGDIVNAADCVIDVHAVAGYADRFVLSVRKSRRGKRGEQLHLRITDMPDGSLALDPAAPLGPLIF